MFACCDEEYQVQTTIGSEITPVVEYVSKKDTEIRHEDSVIKKAGLTPECYLFNNVDEGNPSSILLNVPIQEGVQGEPTSLQRLVRATPEALLLEQDVSKTKRRSIYDDDPGDYHPLLYEAYDHWEQSSE